MSKGAGIHPINAIKNVISIVFWGNICLNDSDCVLLKSAIITAAIVLTDSVMIIILISLSSNLYLPKSKMERQMAKIIIDQICTLERAKAPIDKGLNS
ncbi:hypothetical protein JCM19302_3089 [Jejuia pallidilutea]|uniref:Uncharacterized protein n=1 Tax=Jejuia pallidilutea TaxID=504487 RepID=A0A090W818_9FLAO|nr:hypothetical protein JCM19302_3089 [Jejuia pallidilutea]